LYLRPLVVDIALLMLGNCHTDLVRWNTFYTAAIDALYDVAISAATNDCAVHIGNLRIYG
jgi:hypothetical protein